MTILIIEDDRKMRNELSKLLSINGYETIILQDFKCIVNTVKLSKADIILMDVNLPYEDGFDLCKKIKKEKNIPIVFVTCRNSLEDELLSIESGGIDFITKPYNKSILLSKIKRALNVADPLQYKEILRKGCVLDLHMRTLKYGNNLCELTRNEFKILYYFFTFEDKIITKEKLIEYLWNDKYYLDENILIVNINRLRKKARDIGVEDLIVTVRGKGYKL